jgi:deazaflavin-dependent oxidoreductase (nitroreductase family)
VNIQDKVYLRMQSWMVTNFMRNRPGLFLRFLLRLPILQYKIGLGKSIGDRILILNTRGRITGMPRQTALGYAYDPSTKSYLVMTGWSGRSDWYRNALAEPEVALWVGSMKMLARASKLTLEENVTEIKRMLTLDPFAERMLSELENLPYDGSEDWHHTVADHNPSLRIIPME